MNILFPRSNWHISQANLPLPRALAFTVFGAAVLFCACRPDMSCGRMLFAVTEQQYQGDPFGMLFRPCSQLQASCPARLISKWCPRCRRKKTVDSQHETGVRTPKSHSFSSFSIKRNIILGHTPFPDIPDPPWSYNPLLALQGGDL